MKIDKGRPGAPQRHSCFRHNTQVSPGDVRKVVPQQYVSVISLLVL